MNDPKNSTADETPGDDFMVGFNSYDDTAAPATAAPGADAGKPKEDEAPPAPPATPPAGDLQQGVDIPENGGQVPPQQAPDIDLTSLPDNVRQLLESQQEQVREANESLAQQKRDFGALHERLAPTQRRLEELQRAQQVQPPAQGSAGMATADSALVEAEAYFTTPEFLDYAKAWPEEAKLLKESQLRHLKAAFGRTEQLERMISTEIAPQLRELQTNHRETQHRQAIGQLEQEHPDWSQLNTSDDFWGWFDAEAPYLNFTDEAHRKRRLNDQTFVSHLLTRFKKETGYGQQPGGTPPPAPPVPPVPPAPQNNARLSLATTPEIKGGAGPVRQGAAGITPGDQFMAGFNSGN